MKDISTLIHDIQEVLLKGSTLPQDGLPEKYGTLFANFLRSRYWPSEEKRRGTLRMSNLGKPERQLWYEVNMPEAAEPMPPEAFMKFAFGDVIELLLLFLAEAAGHKVEGTQDEQEINGVKGHRDAVIDGMVVDAKSASSYAFKKFAEGRLEQDRNTLEGVPQTVPIPSYVRQYGHREFSYVRVGRDRCVRAVYQRRGKQLHPCS